MIESYFTVTSLSDKNGSRYHNDAPRQRWNQIYAKLHVQMEFYHHF